MRLDEGVPIEPPPTPWLLVPPADTADDLVGLGADLAPGTVLAAYRLGLFPMPVEGQLGWWSPVTRGILPLDGLRVSRSLRQSCRRYDTRVDTAFAEVIDACADPARPSGWIEDDVREAYLELHRLGWAHSVESWRDGELAGGLYGLTINGLFAGESMFTRQRDASKVALVALVELLHDEYAGRRILDTQWQTPHLATLGVVEIPRRDYLTRLADALAVPLPAAFA